MTVVGYISHRLLAGELKLLDELRAARRNEPLTIDPEFTVSDHIADRVAATMGSWTFIIIQSVILAVWIAFDVTAYVRQWDPTPFILINLALSFQAAHAAPFMMSQNRQACIDSADAKTDYTINAKAELEIELPAPEIDLLRETGLIQVIRRLEARLPRDEIPKTV